MTPKRFEELRDIANDERNPYGVSLHILAECLDEIERLNHCLEEIGAIANNKTFESVQQECLCIACHGAGEVEDYTGNGGVVLKSCYYCNGHKKMWAKK